MKAMDETQGFLTLKQVVYIGYFFFMLDRQAPAIRSANVRS